MLERIHLSHRLDGGGGGATTLGLSLRLKYLVSRQKLRVRRFNSPLPCGKLFDSGGSRHAAYCARASRFRKLEYLLAVGMPERAGQLTKPGVAVEKVRDRNVFLAGIIAAVAFFFSPQLKWQLPQLLVG
jgi:hypothetical protein